jgi:hypothetical protein
LHTHSQLWVVAKVDTHNLIQVETDNLIQLQAGCSCASTAIGLVPPNVPRESTRYSYVELICPVGS